MELGMLSFTMGAIDGQMEQQNAVLVSGS